MKAASGGGSDGNITGALGIPTLDGCGPQGDGLHALHEHVVIASLPRRAAFMAAILCDWRGWSVDQPPAWRCASKRITAVATATFSESNSFAKGMRSRWDARLRAALLGPCASFTDDQSPWRMTPVD